MSVTLFATAGFIYQRTHHITTHHITSLSAGISLLLLNQKRSVQKVLQSAFKIIQYFLVGHQMSEDNYFYYVAFAV